MNDAEIVKKWHLKADNDLKNANHEITHDDPALDTICFHSQQAIEKYLKSFLQMFAGSKALLQYNIKIKEKISTGINFLNIINSF